MKTVVAFDKCWKGITCVVYNVPFTVLIAVALVQDNVECGRLFRS
jgi:hypothetical protein